MRLATYSGPHHNNELPRRAVPRFGLTIAFHSYLTRHCFYSKARRRPVTRSYSATTLIPSQSNEPGSLFFSCSVEPLDSH